MSESYSVYLPNYTVGADCYKEIKNVTARYGKSAVLIGGKTALSKAQDEIIAAAQEAGLKITGIVWYGGNATYENVQMLMDTKEVQDADMVFAVGGGRAVDTCKTMATKMGKPLFAFPTIASNCAACTAAWLITSSRRTAASIPLSIPALLPKRRKNFCGPASAMRFPRNTKCCWLPAAAI